MKIALIEQDKSRQNLIRKTLEKKSHLINLYFSSYFGMHDILGVTTYSDEKNLVSLLVQNNEEVIILSKDTIDLVGNINNTDNRKNYLDIYLDNLLNSEYCGNVVVISQNNSRQKSDRLTFLPKFFSSTELEKALTDQNLIFGSVINQRKNTNYSIISGKETINQTTTYSEPEKSLSKPQNLKRLAGIRLFKNGKR